MTAFIFSDLNKRAKIALYRSPDKWPVDPFSFTPGLYIVIWTSPLLPMKFRVNWFFGSGEEAAILDLQSELF